MNKQGLEEKDLKSVVEAHGGLVRMVIDFGLDKEGKLVSELVSTEKLVLPVPPVPVVPEKT